MEKRNRYASEFKPKVVMEVLREQETVNQIAAEYELNSQMVSMWKREFIEKALGSSTARPARRSS